MRNNWERFGKPNSIRCVNDPEYISHALATWAGKNHIDIQFIQPSNPQQSAHIERYNWLNQYLFDSIEQVQEYATMWM